MVAYYNVVASQLHRFNVIIDTSLLFENLSHAAWWRHLALDTVNANINHAQHPADAGGFHKTVEYKQTSRHTVFESAILHNIEMSLRLIRCKIRSDCEILVPWLKYASFRDSAEKPSIAVNGN